MAERTEMKNRDILYSIFLIIFNVANVYCQNRLENIPTAFNNIPSKPHIYYFTNPGVHIPSGGHLQGIQTWNDSNTTHFVITASSADTAYYAIINSNQLKQIVTLNTSPYRHAGGCQLNDKMFAVGIEDNIAKTSSKICLMQADSLLTGSKGKIVYERKGVYKRSTAGAVGLTQMNNGKYLIAVGDWDSRNVDFYLSRNAAALLFESLTSYHVPDNEKWYSYQSLNLLTDSSGKLFLIGFCKDGIKNRADLYELNIESGKCNLQLISTRYFHCTHNASFRYASGIGISGNKPVIYACGRKIHKHNYINIFGN
jgi:hypothetical protein